MRRADRFSMVLRHAPLTARWTSLVSGTPVAAAAVAVLVAVLRQHPRAAGPHRQQVRRLGAPVPRRLKAPLRPGAELRRLLARRLVRRRVVRRRVARRRVVERRVRGRLAVAVVAGEAGVISPALLILMARSTLRSARWPATPTACRR